MQICARHNSIIYSMLQDQSTIQIKMMQDVFDHVRNAIPFATALS